MLQSIVDIFIEESQGCMHKLFLHCTTKCTIYEVIGTGLYVYFFCIHVHVFLYAGVLSLSYYSCTKC